MTADARRALADALEQLAKALRAEATDRPPGVAPSAGATPTWRERVWICPPETRLGVRELGEALGRPRSWVYRTARSIPHRKLGGELVFIAAEVRQWIVEHEIHEGPGTLVMTRRRPVKAGA